ncbi:MAG: response regulator, partial [Longicatena sp.]
MNEKILLIEDDKNIIKFLSLSLETNHYKLINTTHGIEGISLFMTDNPDLILLDLGLPDIDGMEVLKQIRAQSEVAIIVV